MEAESLSGTDCRRHLVNKDVYLLTRTSMNGDNVLKLLSRTMEDILNIFFSNNLDDFTACMGVLCMPVSSKFLTESTGEKIRKLVNI